MPPPAPALGGWSFAGITVDGVSGPRVEEVLDALGFTRARGMSAPALPQTHAPGGAGQPAVVAPDGTVVVFTAAGRPAGFLPTGERPGPGRGLTRIDHVGLPQPFDVFEEAGLFHRAVLGLEPQEGTEVAAPFGLLRIRGMATPDRAVRLALSAPALRRGDWAPGVPEPQYVAFATDDRVATARALRAAGVPLLPLPENYAADLDARLDLAPGLLAAVREHGLMYEEDGEGGYLHVSTEVLGDRVFFEVVQRLGAHDGYGSADVAVRTAAHRRCRRTPAASSADGSGAPMVGARHA